MDRTESTAHVSQAARRRLGRKTAGSACVAVILGLGLLWWAGGVGFLVGGNNASRTALRRSPHGETGTHSPAQKPTAHLAANTAGDQAQAMARQIVGEWEQINKGKRILTVRDDGTATMQVTLDGAWSYVVGEKLEFEIEWKIQGERLLFNMISGKPEGSMKLIASMYGKERNHRIDKLTAEQMILIDEQDDSHDKWKRIASAAK